MTLHASHTRRAAAKLCLMPDGIPVTPPSFRPSSTTERVVVRRLTVVPSRRLAPWNGRTLRAMCLLILISGVVPGMPLIVAANRDERRARPTVPMTRLDDGAGGLAILGGRDEVGGGTWLATNAAGGVPGLTNRPLRDGPDAAKRSRGELPLALAAHPTAAAAVEAFGNAIDPSVYNPSWLLVADRHDVFFVDVTGTEQVVV